jgi:hypothetical protein
LRPLNDLTRRVGIELYLAAATPRLLANDEAVPSNAVFFATYRNLDPGEVFLLVFAVDAKGEVHWLYPGHPNPNENPAALRLEQTSLTPMREAVMLDAPEVGALRVVTFVSRDRLSIRDIESLPPEQRTLRALQTKWPSASIREQALRVFEPQRGR